MRNGMPVSLAKSGARTYRFDEALARVNGR
jgi:hypothetical protein